MVSLSLDHFVLLSVCLSKNIQIKYSEGLVKNVTISL